MKLGDFLNNLALKTGTEIDLTVISNKKLEELNQIELDDTVATTLDSGLMSLDGAKNNPTIANHYKAITLKPFDNKLNALIEKLGLGEDLIKEVSTFKRLELSEAKIEAKIAEIESKQGGGNKEKEAQLTAQLQKLQGDLTRISEEKTAEISRVQSQYENEITQMHVNTLLSGKKFATKDLPQEVNLSVARTLIDSKLKEAGAQLIRKDGQLKLVQSAIPEMDYFDASNKPVSYAQFVDKVLADNKLLEVNNGGNPTPTPQPMPVNVNPVNTAKFNDAAMAAINDLNN